MMPILYLFCSDTSIKKSFFINKKSSTINKFSKAFKCCKYNMELAQRMAKLSSKSKFSWSCMLLEYNWRSNVTIVDER